MSELLRQLFMNVGGDPGNDQPWIQPDNPPHAPRIPTTFPASNRLKAEIPAEHTGGATVFYQQGTKDFRVILPPVDQQFQAEAGEPPQLPPEYNGDPDKVALHYDEPTAPARPGICRIVDRAWQDDRGKFFVLGDTLFWGAGGVQREGPDRFRKNCRYLRAHTSDCIRMLGSVGWQGEAIDPRSPGYALAHAIDIAYEEGLRTKLTVIGGGLPDPVGLARLILPIVVGRREKVILVESANETFATEDEAIAIAKMFRPLVPVSVGLGNQGYDITKPTSLEADAPVLSVHTARGGGGAREAGQGWKLQEDTRHWAVDDGEPPGPGSSVSSQTDPRVLAAMVVMAKIGGAGLFIRHSGDGVKGTAYQGPTGPRYANLYDRPGMDALLDAYANALIHLPDHMTNWQPFNNPHQFDVAFGSAEKIYGSRLGGVSVECALECSNPVTFRAKDRSHVQVVDSVRGVIVAEHEVNAGGTFEVRGLWAPVLIGTRL